MSGRSDCGAQSASRRAALGDETSSQGQYGALISLLWLAGSYRTAPSQRSVSVSLSSPLSSSTRPHLLSNTCSRLISPAYSPLAAATMTDAALPTMSKRGSVRRQIHPFPLFDTPALLQLLTEHNIRHTWATLLHSTLLHHTSALTHPATASSPPPSDLLSSVLSALASSSLSPPSSLLPLLAAHTSVLSSSISKQQTSGDGTTTKLLVRLADGELVEAVIIRHRAKQLPYEEAEEENGPDGPEEAVEQQAEQAEEEQKEEKAERRTSVKRAGRITLCVSSQVGCKQGCTFCATGTLGLRGHLMAGEIVEQLIHANRVLAAESGGGASASSNLVPHITNIVYMGQGEPLDNYAAVLSSVRSFTSARLFRVSPSRVTVSTVGLAHRIQSLAMDAPHVQLALSLHAPTQPLRLSLVPSAAAHTLDRLMAALADYIERTPRGKRVLIEYVLLHAVNDQPQHATQLVELLTPLSDSVRVNLIPWNVADVPGQYQPPTKEAVHTFQRLVQQGGLWCSVRQEMGRDVDGACGQLALKSRRANGEDSGAKATSGGCGGDDSGVRDIEDVVGGHSGGGDQGKVSSRLRRRRVDRLADEEKRASSGAGETAVSSAGTTAASVAAQRTDGDVSFDWCRSFAVFLLPLLVIVALSFYFRYG